MCACVCVCVDKVNLKYALRWHISSFRIIPVYRHKHTYTHIHIPFQDSETDGTKSGHCHLAHIRSKPSSQTSAHQPAQIFLLFPQAHIKCCLAQTSTITACSPHQLKNHYVAWPQNINVPPAIPLSKLTASPLSQ